MRSNTQIVKQFKSNWISDLDDESIAQACRDAGMTWKDSMLNPVVTVQIFLIRFLHGNTSCQQLPHLCEMVFTAAVNCKARMRVKLKVFERLLRRCFVSIEQQTLDAGRWFGHRVFMVDGSSFSMPDTVLLDISGGTTSELKNRKRHRANVKCQAGATPVYVLLEKLLIVVKDLPLSRVK